MNAQEPKVLFKGQLVPGSKVYEMGWTDANLHHKVSGISSQFSARALMDEVTNMVLEPGTRRLTHKTPPGSWPGFMRAQEHIVSDIDPTTGATPHGIFPVQSGGSAWADGLAETWTSDAMPALNYARLIEQASGQPVPPLPQFATLPTAGPQPGEKQPMYSRAFDIVADDGTVIDGSLYLNVSYLLIDAGFGPLVRAVMASAVAAEANSQIAAAVEAGATTGGLDIFTGRYVPNVVIVPPSQLGTVPVADYRAAGMDVVMEPNATSVMFADRNAIVGFFRKMSMEQAEPSTSGVGMAFKVYGKVAVDSTGVGKVVTTP